jgi:hypothetical protein
LLRADILQGQQEQRSYGANNAPAETAQVWKHRDGIFIHRVFGFGGGIFVLVFAGRSIFELGGGTSLPRRTESHFKY